METLGIMPKILPGHCNACIKILKIGYVYTRSKIGIHNKDAAARARTLAVGYFGVSVLRELMLNPC
jgi:hypothetical protein